MPVKITQLRETRRQRDVERETFNIGPQKSEYVDNGNRKGGAQAVITAHKSPE